MKIALTGGTGFIGRRLTAHLRENGHHVRRLLRNQADRAKAEDAVIGSLGETKALSKLVDDVDTVIHLAGLVRAVNAAGFQETNVEGTRRLVQALKPTNSSLLLVSSLAAREPSASGYANSKYQAEAVAREALEPQRLCILRPPAIYGPGDPVTMPIFKQIASGLLVMPSARDSRFSLLYVDDLIELIETILRGEAPWQEHHAIEPDDGCARGYTWSELCQRASKVLERKVRFVRLPQALTRPLAMAFDGVARILDRPLMLSSDKLGELYHSNWVASGTVLPNWSARVDFEAGLAATLAWYQGNQWRYSR